MTLRNLIVASSLGLSLASVALAASKKDLNCDINGKMKHVATESACTKKKGTWKGAEAAMKAAPEAPKNAAPAEEPMKTEEAAPVETK